jgi:hypothetical protein
MAESLAQAQLDALAKEFAAVRARFAALNAAVSDAQWARRPSPGEWSVAECLAHLNLTSAAMVPRVRAALVEARGMPGVGARSYRGGLTGRVLASMMGPVPILLGVKLGKVRTPPPFVPGSELPREQIVAELRRWQDDEIALLRESSGLAIDQVSMLSPFAANVRYDVYSSLRIMVRHELRHVVQAERTLGRLGA